MSMININPESLEMMCNRIDHWAENLKETVAAQANQELNQVDGLPGFEGQAPEAYRQKFHDLTVAINQAIEQISDQQLGGMRDALTQLNRTFQDADNSAAINLRV
jgi:uncharacterized protein YukE